MATKSLKDIHTEALREFDRIYSVGKDEREQAIEDRRFYSITSAQWEGALGEQFEHKPRMEFNKVHLAVIRIINEYRNNRIDITFTPKSGDEDALADTCSDLYRADEQDSAAEEAYDNAFEEAVGGGFGAFRLKAEYEDESDEENDKQRIRILPIYDADSTVFFDLDAKRQNKSDAKRCFVLTPMSRELYKETYDDEPSDWPVPNPSSVFNWVTPEVVYVAEYYRVEDVREKVHIYEGLDGEESRYTDSNFEADPQLMEMLEVQRATKVRERKITRRKVRKYIMSGAAVLEDCGYIAGKYIPVIPVYGKRWFVQGIERYMGHVRLAKDAQRLGNMLRSKLAEISAANSFRKPIFTAEQMAGHAPMWAQDNTENYPYMLVNKVEDASGQAVPMGPVGFTETADVPPALAALLQIAEQDMRDILGSQENAEKIVSNISGKAVEMIQQHLDMQTFIYMSNKAKARQWGAEVWLSMAADLYVEEGRKMKGIGLQNEANKIELMRPVIDEKTSAVEYENDLSKAAMDVVVDVGPSSSSKRQAVTRDLMNLLALAQDPADRSILSSMILMNTEGEGMGDVRTYYRKKLLMMGVITPTEEEKQEIATLMQNQEPDPQKEWLKADAERATAEAADLRAGTVKKIADAEQSRAKTSEILASIDNAELEQLLQVLERINQARLGQ